MHQSLMLFKNLKHPKLTISLLKLGGDCLASQMSRALPLAVSTFKREMYWVFTFLTNESRLCSKCATLHILPHTLPLDVPTFKREMKKRKGKVQLTYTPGLLWYSMVDAVYQIRDNSVIRHCFSSIWDLYSLGRSWRWKGKAFENMINLAFSCILSKHENLTC